MHQGKYIRTSDLTCEDSRGPGYLSYRAGDPDEAPHKTTGMAALRHAHHSKRKTRMITRDAMASPMVTPQIIVPFYNPKMDRYRGRVLRSRVTGIMIRLPTIRATMAWYGVTRD